MGDAVNVASVDVQRVIESITFLNGLWLPLIWIVICFVYLWQVCWGSGGPGLNPVSICTLDLGGG